jgi:UDP-GlcNAc:undecaprenyl-phosphate/decaprenyl-phosphate GlcNAc-1-phosphate transferase
MSVLYLSILSLLVAFLFSFLFVLPTIKFAYKIGIIDDPKKNKHPKVIHTYPIPRGGGLAIYLGILIASLIFLPVDKHLLGILTGATILVIVGLLDDKYNISPYKRLFLQFAAASIPIATGIGISFISNPLGGTIDLSNPQITFDFLGQARSIWILSDLFALFWIVFLMNMLNMGAKGVDGQLSGVVIIAALTIAALSLRFSADIAQWPVIILASITAGAYLGFLPWHVYPQKIMPSHSGSTLAGYLLAVLAILSTAKVGILIVVLGVPIIDTTYTIFRRILQGKSPVWGDRGHLHHRLLDAGLSKRQVALFYWLSSIMLGILAVNLNTTTKIYTIIGIASIVGGLLLWLTYRSKLSE